MTGFTHNVIGGIEHFLARLTGAVTDAEKAALQSLSPSFHAVVAAIELHGPQIIQAVTSAMAAAALAAITSGSGTFAEIASVAGKAAIAAGEATAASAGKKLAGDVLHAIATAQVSAAQAVVTPAAVTAPPAG